MECNTERTRVAWVTMGISMKRVCLLLAAALAIPVLALQAQSDKNDAAVTPVSVLGEVSEGEKRIIFVRLQAELSKHYALVSQAEYQEAEDIAFERLEADQCTEERCIRIIQEILQVDRLFALQLVREDRYTQVSPTLVRGKDKIIREETCEDCTIPQLNSRVESLVAQIFRADSSPAPAEPPPEPPVAEAPVVAGAEAEPFVPGVGTLIAGSVLSLYAVAQYSIALDFNDRAKSKSDSDPQKSKSLESDRDAAATQATLALLIGGGLLTLYFTADDPAQTAGTGGWQITPMVALGHADPAPVLAIRFRW